MITQGMIMSIHINKMEKRNNKKKKTKPDRAVPDNTVLFRVLSFEELALWVLSGVNSGNFVENKAKSLIFTRFYSFLLLKSKIERTASVDPCSPFCSSEVFAFTSAKNRSIPHDDG